MHHLFHMRDLGADIVACDKELKTLRVRKLTNSAGVKAAGTMGGRGKGEHK